jgi:SAM-dependent methyltransferase
VRHLPREFTPDLRRLKNWPSMKDSPWRLPDLADLTYGEIYRIVSQFVPDRKLRILDVGCGWGSVCLELARRGHNVLGLDMNPDNIKIANRAMNRDPNKSRRGALSYRVADFSSWTSQDKYDLVLLSRVLHHFPRPVKTLAKVKDLLSPGGRIVCIEYAYDRFDRRSATWFYHIRRVLEQAGWFASKQRVSDDMRASVNKIMKEWQTHGRKHRLNRSTEMYKPLRELFREKHFSWKPYIFWDIIMDMRIPTHEIETALARSLKEMEEALIGRHTISPILFCFMGQNQRR